METWGELFWDAWIRFRLWCRSLGRTVWPPRVEAWQVCTVTGVAAIVLTLLSLRNPTGKLELAGQPGKSSDKQVRGQSPISGGTTTGRPAKPINSPPAVEPYEAAASDEAVVVEEDIVLEGNDSRAAAGKRAQELEPTDSPATNSGVADSDAMDAEATETLTEPAPSKGFSKRQARNSRTESDPTSRLNSAVDEPGFEVDSQMTADLPSARSGDEATVDVTVEDTEAKPIERRGRARVPDTDVSDEVAHDSDEQTPEVGVNSPSRQPAVRTRELSEDAHSHSEESHTEEAETKDFAPRVRRTEEIAGEVPGSKSSDEIDSEKVDSSVAPSALKLGPARTPGHYTRPHHEHEEEGHEHSKMPVARSKVVEFSPPPEPEKAVVRSNGHYRRFGEDDDQRNSSDEEIQPRRVDPATRVTESEVKEDETEVVPPVALPMKTPAAESEELPADEVPPVPSRRINRQRTEAFEAPVEKKAATTPGTELMEVETEVVSLDAGTHPPIVFAPEPEEPPLDVTISPDSTVPPSQPDFVGPHRSTLPSEHESHVDEDVVVRGKRKQPIKMKVPVARTHDQEFEEPAGAGAPGARPEFHGPVSSTDAVDHEAHVEEDVLITGKRKRIAPMDHPPAEAVVPPAPEAPLEETHSPAGEEKSAPVVTSVPEVKLDFHGPARSTTPVDHEAHLDEDVLVKEKRKKPLMLDLPGKPVEFHGPVLSTDATDHESHEKEDAYTGENPRNTKSWPVPKAVRPSSEHQTRQPVVSEEAAEEKADIPNTPTQPAAAPIRSETETSEEVIPVPQGAKPTRELVDPPAGEESEVMPPDAPRPPAENSSTTNSRTVPPTAPRVIRHDEDASESPLPVTRTFVPEEVETPAAPELTQPRGPVRITIPERVRQPEDLPVSPRRARLPDTQPSRKDVPESSREPLPTAPRVSPVPKLTMEITGPRSVPVGTQIVLHFKITNVGRAAATGIVVSDVLPPGLTHRQSADLEYTIARLAPGESRETNLMVQCTGSGLITNRAVLTADGDVTAEAAIQIEATGSSGRPTSNSAALRAPVMLTHRGPERWLVDSTGQFLVTVTNTSGTRLKDVTIVETYPAETNLIHATTGHKVDGASRTVSWTIQDFAPGASYVLETELHSTRSGRLTTSVRVKIDGTDVAEDRWTAVSYPNGVLP